MLIIYNSDTIRLCLTAALHIYEDFACLLGMYIISTIRKRPVVMAVKSKLSILLIMA